MIYIQETYEEGSETTIHINVGDIDEVYFGQLGRNLVLFKDAGTGGVNDIVYMTILDYWGPVDSNPLTGPVCTIDLTDDFLEELLLDPEDIVSRLGHIEQNVPYEIQNQANDYGTSSRIYDPLVLDFNGDADSSGNAFELHQPGGWRHFDFDSNGFAEDTGWLYDGQGFLVRDLNDNGRIDNGGEMFGDTTTNGFAALAAHDTNLDGKITSADTVWGDLMVWIDSNEDAQTLSSELHTMTDLEITEINLAATAVNQIVNSQTITHTGTFVQDGVTRAAANVSFQIGTVNSVYAADYDLDPVAAIMPTLRGYGILPHLTIAMSNDKTGTGNLLSLMTDLVASLSDLTTVIENYDSIRSDVADILFRWAGVENVALDSRGVYVADARTVGFVEKYFDTPFVDETEGNGQPGLLQAQEIDAVWNQILKDVTGKFLLQALGFDLFNGSYAYDSYLGEFKQVQSISAFDATQLGALEDYATALTTTQDREDFWLNLTQYLDDVSDALLNGNTAPANFGLTTGMETDLNAAVEASDSALTWYIEDHSPSLSVTSIEYRYLNPVASTIEGTSGADSYTVNSIFAGTASDDVIVGYAGADILKAGAGPDLLYGHNASGDGDDNAADHLNGEAGNDVLFGGGGNDTLIGGQGEDYLVGGAGDDIIIDGGSNTSSPMEQSVAEGGSGDDDYYYSGSVTGRSMLFINEAEGEGVDELFFHDGTTEKKWAASNLSMFRIYNDDLKIEIYDGATKKADIVVTDMFVDFDINNDKGLERIKLWETTSSSNVAWFDLKDYFDNLTTTFLAKGSNNSETIYGDVIGSINDNITGGDGNDTLYGVTGNDILDGGNNDDLLDGGAGDDTLTGGAGNDTYRYTGGIDTITAPSGTGEKIVFGEGIEFSELSFHRTLSNHLMIVLDSSNTLTVNNYFASSGNSAIVTQFEFEEDNSVYTILSSIFTDRLITKGTDSGETIAVLGAYTGVPTIERIYAYGGNDTITFNTTRPAEVYGGDGNDTMNSSTKADKLYGEGGNDTLSGGDNNDTLDGGSGDDSMNGGAGNDIFYFASGLDTAIDSAGTDKLILTGTTLNDITVSNSGTVDVKVVLSSGVNELTLQNYRTSSAYVIETLEFDNGFSVPLSGYATWTSGTSSADTLTGTSSSNVIIGKNGNDTIDGAGGDDYLEGGLGDDNLTGGTGNDAFNGGAGADMISFSSASTGFIIYRDSDLYLTIKDVANTTSTGHGTDRIYDSVESIVFSDITLNLSTLSLTLNGAGWGNATINGTTSSDTINGYPSADQINANNGNDTVHGNQGDDVIYGGDGSDTLYGDDGSDLLYGQAGLDTFWGGAGDDTFIFEVASAYSQVDLVKDFSTSQGDALDISALLTGYNPLTDLLTDFVQITENTTTVKSALYVDRDGLSSAYGFVQIASLEGIIGLTDESALVTSNSLIVT